MTPEPVTGRVLLDSGLPLAGFSVELTIDGTTVTATSDADGEFRLACSGCAGEPASSELVVRMPDQQVLLRDNRRLDTDYVSLILPRSALPRTGVRRGVPISAPQPEAPAAIVARDVGQRDEISLPFRAETEGSADVRLAATAGSIVVAVAGRARTVQPDRSDAPYLQLDGTVVDVVAVPDRTALLFLVATGDHDAGRRVVSIDAGESRTVWEGTGPWDRLATTAAATTVVAADTQSGRWAVLDGDVRDERAVEPPIGGVAVWTGGVLLVSGDGLVVADLDGHRLHTMPWPGTVPTLIGTDNDAAVVYDPDGGRASRILIGTGGTLDVDATVLLGPAQGIGWWEDRKAVLALQRDRIHWWRPPPLPTFVTPQPIDEIIFIGPV
jgi:hypothetical protein